MPLLPRPDQPELAAASDAVDVAHLDADRRLLRAVGLTLLVPAVAFIGNDLAFTALRPFWHFVAARGTLVLSLLAVVALVSRAQDRRTFERQLVPMTALVLIAQMTLRLLRPSDSLQPALYEPVSVLLVFGAFPVSLRALLALVVPFAATSIGLTLFWVQGPPTALKLSVALTMVTATGVGALVAANRRRLLEELVAARVAQAKALTELRTLRGIIPVCSGCSSVRVGDDQWQALQSYVAAHTDAEFSHGLCPGCQTRLYPGLFDEATPLG